MAYTSKDILAENCYATYRIEFFSQMPGIQTEAYDVILQKSTNGEIAIEDKHEDNAYKCLYLLHGWGFRDEYIQYTLK